jgi:hypothetical protein
MHDRKRVYLSGILAISLLFTVTVSTGRSVDRLESELTPSPATMSDGSSLLTSERYIALGMLLALLAFAFTRKTGVRKTFPATPPTPEPDSQESETTVATPTIELNEGVAEQEFSEERSSEPELAASSENGEKEESEKTEKENKLEPLAQDPTGNIGGIDDTEQDRTLPMKALVDNKSKDEDQGNF